VVDDAIVRETERWFLRRGLPHFIADYNAAHGLPVVCTSLLAEQLGWQDGEHLLAADDAESIARHCARLMADEKLWLEIRTNALARVREECSRVGFLHSLEEILWCGDSDSWQPAASLALAGSGRAK